MNCPECGGELVYDEHVNGIYTCPLSKGVIDWKEREFSGECYGHAIRCSACGYELPKKEFERIIERSVE